jgi:uncharacterized membrane-anchored protein
MFAREDEGHFVCLFKKSTDFWRAKTRKMLFGAVVSEKYNIFAAVNAFLVPFWDVKRSFAQLFNVAFSFYNITDS